MKIFIETKWNKIFIAETFNDVLRYFPIRNEAANERLSAMGTAGGSGIYDLFYLLFSFLTASSRTV